MNWLVTITSHDLSHIPNDEPRDKPVKTALKSVEVGAVKRVLIDPQGEFGGETNVCHNEETRDQEDSGVDELPLEL